MISVTVLGEPIPQGSMRAFVRGGRAAVTSDNPRLRSWRQDVASVLAGAGERFNGPVKLAVHFYLPRPASHFGRRGTILPSAPPFPVGARADLDKLVRAIGDAATAAGVWRDDGQVVRITASKLWCDIGGAPCAEIVIRELEP